MAISPQSRPVFRFDGFEVDFRSGELRKHGIRTRLQDQPFQVLRVLLENHGEVVSREELKQKLWPAETFVDFDDGLNTAIKKVRDVLGDSAEHHRHIETIPRRGYRFIGTLEAEASTASVAESAQEVAADAPPLSTPCLPGTAPSALPRQPARRKALMLAMAAVTFLVGVALWIRRPVPVDPPQPVSRFSIALAPGERLAAVDQPQPALAISPDGSLLAYVANLGGTQQQVYLRSINSLEAVAIPDSDGGNNVFFSPDGQEVGFFVEGTLKKFSVTGGAPVSVASFPRISLPMGGTWAPDGNIVLGFENEPVLSQVPANGGPSKPATSVDYRNGETKHAWPAFLPGGKTLLYTVVSGPNDPAKIVARTLATGEQRDLISGGSRPMYVRSGHLAYAQEGTLMAVPFDLEKLQVTGSPVAVLKGVMRCLECGGGQYGISDNGVLAYIPENSSPALRELVWVDRQGKEQLLPAPARSYARPVLSPDGRRIVVGSEGQSWIYDLSRATLTRMADGGNPTWTADGERVAFQAGTNGRVNVYWQKTDGSAQAEQLTSGEGRQAPGGFSADGKLLAFSEVSPTTGSNIWVLRLSDRQARPFIEDPSDQTAPRFSPDGRWLAYTSDESGRREIYVRAYPDRAGKWKLSIDGGVEPLWNRNGRELFYRDGDKVLAVDVNARPSFSAGKPRVLFEGRYVRAQGSLPNYDVSPDGQRFLMLKSVEQPAAQINVVLNWFEELKEKVPTGKK